jgi:hypothetical protein
MSFLNSKYTLPIILLLQAILYIIVLYLFDGTGDSGDSVMHYLFAKHSFQHHELFFDHWAKPLFVLLASPFAQFSMLGMKLFNACVMLVCSAFTFKTIEKLRIENPGMGAIILICTPLTFVLTFSGLTEPLFATLLIASLYLFVSDRLLIGCITASLLPFVRSEGLIILGVIFIYLLARRELKRIPWLATGSIMYMLAGAIVKGNLLWVFTEIPYAQLESPYHQLYSEKGRIFHFIIQMNYVVGVPTYALFWIGVVSYIVNIRKIIFNLNLTILVLGSFAAFFIAHSLFWYLGIFNSMGLKRVLIGIMPLIAIISLTGLNTVLSLAGRSAILKKIVLPILLIVLLVFPFTSNPAAIHWEKDLNLASDQKLTLQIATFLQENSLSDRRMFYMHPYLSESLSLDWFDSSKRGNLNKEGINEIQSGDVVIWDNWFAVVEGGITEDYLLENESFSELHSLYVYDHREVRFRVFEYQKKE